MNTFTPEPQPATYNQPEPPEPSNGRSGWMIGFLISTLVAIISLGIAIASVASNPVSSTAHKQCLEALDQADLLIDIYSEALTSTGDALTAYTNSDYLTMETHTEELNTATGQLEDTLPLYFYTRGECRGN